MVDAVITWVDGADRELSKKRKRFIKADSSMPSANPALQPTRWRDNNEIYYCVKLLRKNASWIENIFLVTDNQCPKWLDEASARTLGITIVDHKTVFAGMEEYLPTFNSCSIESVLHRIPNLSREFLYFNDDIFVVREIAYSDFFRRGKPVPRGRWFWAGSRTMQKFVGQPTDYRANGYVAYGGGNRNRAYVFKTFYRGHAPLPLSVPLQKKYLDTKTMRRNLRFKFRDKAQIEPLDFVINRVIRLRGARVGPRDWAHIPRPKNITGISLIDRLEMIKRSPDLKTVCVQSIDEFDADSKCAIFNLLEQFIVAE